MRFTQLSKSFFFSYRFSLRTLCQFSYFSSSLIPPSLRFEVLHTLPVRCPSLNASCFSDSISFWYCWSLQASLSSYISSPPFSSSEGSKPFHALEWEKLLVLYRSFLTLLFDNFQSFSRRLYNNPGCSGFIVFLPCVFPVSPISVKYSCVFETLGLLQTMWNLDG